MGADALGICGGYSLGNYGRLVAGEVPMQVQYALLHEQLLIGSHALLLAGCTWRTYTRGRCSMHSCAPARTCSDVASC